MVPNSAYSGTRTNHGSNLFRMGGTSTNGAISAGHMVLQKGHLTGGSPSYLVFVVTATSLSSGQVVYIVCYNESATTGLPSTLAWSQSVTVGTTTATYETAVSSKDIPTTGYAIGILNPSGNAGTCTFTSANSYDGYFTASLSLYGRMGLTCTNQSTTPSSDLSSYTALGTGGSSGATFQPNATVAPMIWAR
jgi:hypothetical protein